MDIPQGFFRQPRPRASVQIYTLKRTCGDHHVQGFTAHVIELVRAQLSKMGEARERAQTLCRDLCPSDAEMAEVRERRQNALQLGAIQAVYPARAQHRHWSLKRRT